MEMARTRQLLSTCTHANSIKLAPFRGEKNSIDNACMLHAYRLEQDGANSITRVCYTHTRNGSSHCFLELFSRMWARVVCMVCGCSVDAGVDVSRNAVTRMQRMRNVCDRMRRACGRLLYVSRNAVTVISEACGKRRGLKLPLCEALSYSSA